MAITVRAIYRNGVLKPSRRLDLPEGATVELNIQPTAMTAADAAPDFHSLAGIWGHLSDQELAQLEESLTANRHRSARKLESLAQDVQDDLSG